MSKLHMFTVYDDKAKAYLTPFFLPQIGLAIRAFSDAASDPSHAFCQHPEDYTLFKCGTFDQQSGVAEFSLALEVVGTALEFRRPLAKE